jgi:alpha-glucosidase
MYPFARNHNSLAARSQEPYAFNEEYVLEASLNSLRLRYSLLKYYYSVYATNSGVGTVFSPLFVYFPDDTTCLDIQTQAMIGPALLITPILTESKIGNFTKITPYFPEGVWFSIQNSSLRFKGRSLNSF